LRATGIARAHPQMLNDDVVRADRHAAADQRDAGARRGLARNGQKRLGDRQHGRAEIDDAANLEDDDARSLCLHRGGERARAVSVEIGDLDDASAASARRFHAETDRARKRHCGWRRRCGRARRGTAAQGQPRTAENEPHFEPGQVLHGAITMCRAMRVE
jgi:hypothetical protein